MDFYRHLFVRDKDKPITFFFVYLISVVFTFQSLVTSYSSSAYLENFIEVKYIGLLYSIGAVISIILSLTLPYFLRRFGNVLTVLILAFIISLSLIFIGLALSVWLVIFSFIVYYALSPTVYLNIDIFLETLIGTEENATGSKRGLVLALMSLAGFLSPLAMGYIIGPENNLASVYFFGAFIGLIFITIVIARFRRFADPLYTTVKISSMLHDAARNIDVRTVMFAQFLLQLFYTWAVIYIPLYLASELKFDWPTISLIIAAGLFAFVIFEYPIGIIADRHIGEKEMMALGFMILTLSSAALSFFAAFGAISWMFLMFFSRMGASLVEVTTESYFFKKISGHEANLISLFRLMRPLASLVGALIASVSLAYLPFNFTFLILALIMVTGVFGTTFLTDTK